jgi:hypothetical protein
VDGGQKNAESYLHYQGFCVFGNNGANHTVYNSHNSLGAQTTYQCYRVGDRVGFLVDMGARWARFLPTLLLQP